MLKKGILFFANLVEKPFSPVEVIDDRYQIINHLGMGSYGHSYIVRDLLDHKVKVLKALRIHKRITRQGRRGFELEKKLLAAIDHPGFPKYFEEGTHKNIPYYTMELIDGRNFEQLIFTEGWKISERDAFQIVVELLGNIEYLHDHNIVHRDIRIPNVIFDGARIKLIDLGLGTYVNKEEASRKVFKRDLRKEINYQADFYGLGHFLLFLLYSNFTFDKNDKEKSWEEELNISKEAKQIIRRLLQIEQRYEHCSEIKSDIKNLQGI